MLGTLYLLTISGAMLAAMRQASLIKAGLPIRHGRWLAVYVAIGVLLAVVIIHSWWSLLALIGMAGIFSMYFRIFLNALRGKLPSYMGPDATDTSATRSQYDLLCWRIANILMWPPYMVAICIESTAACGVALLFTFFHP